MKKRVIIPLESRPYFTEMLRVAGLIKKKSNYEVIFLLNSEIQSDEREILKEHEIGYSVFSPESRAPQKLGFVGKVLFRFSIAQFVLSLENFLRLKKVAARFVKDLAPSLIVFPHIEWGRLSGFMLLESLNHQIPTLVIPYAWNPVKESVVARLSQRPYQLTFWRKCILKIFNLEKKHKWVRQGIIQQPLPGLIALEFARGVRHDAWNASALASFTGVESEMMLRSFIDDGGSTDRCFIVGSLAQDRLYQAVQQENIHICGRYILCALPPDQTGNQIPGFEFAHYLEMVTKWLDVLSRDRRYKIVVSLHPRIRHLKKWVHENFDVTVYDGDILDLLPQCAFFVCSLTGIARSAASLGIPTIYYDCFHYQLNEYAEATNLQLAHTFAEFEGLLHNFCDKFLVPKTYSELSDVAKKWGIIDGKSSERIFQLIEQSVSDSVNSPHP